MVCCYNQFVCSYGLTTHIPLGLDFCCVLFCCVLSLYIHLVCTSTLSPPPHTHTHTHTQSLTEGVVLLIQHVALSCGRLGCILHCVCPGLVHADTTQGVMHAHTTQPIIEQQQLASDVETGLQSNGTHEKSELIMNSMGLTMNSTSLLALQTALEAVGHVAGSDAHECSVGRCVCVCVCICVCMHVCVRVWD